jgi:hypothetical protein
LPAFFAHVSHVDHDPHSKNALLKLLGPSAFSDLLAPFFTSPLRGVLRSLCHETRRAHTRVWLPSLRAVQAFKDPSRHNRSPTLLGFSLQSFSPFQWSKVPYRAFFPLLHLEVKTSRALPPCFSGFIPPGKPSHFCPQSINLGRELCSLGFLGFSGFPFVMAHGGSSPSTICPLILTLPKPHDFASDGSRGLPPTTTQRFPFRDAGLSSLSCQVYARHLLGRSACRGLFFHLKSQEPSYDSLDLLLATHSLPPFREDGAVSATSTTRKDG